MKDVIYLYTFCIFLHFHFIVHQTDHCRLDLIIPGEQHFYVRAATSQERQQWLVALGSAKASQKNARKPDETVVNRGNIL